MCDAGEKVSNTMKREFLEEALNSYEISSAELETYKKKLNHFFENGIEVIKCCDYYSRRNKFEALQLPIRYSYMTVTVK